ncbi:hypothetical protein LTR56_011087 [Elasticomyces elasticus]|nr:hypothetical protein LTR56_011087 [Elasticomyces elasticus]KAK3662490.1 hypothetical protein LTR22_006771 [Elasticomyces elasticus]KAK4926479.1 hypothetical protein LTR49_006688 [Elasticomyces elasticus]KAK5689337.1 hypothetical protein LTR17_026336 [Elasticomyces elasticus]KAK5761147.1 hypothetical protein LTS12_008626 [Elasticomyces elasticus]
MPRDLAALKEDTLQGMPQLTKSPEEVEGRQDQKMDAADELKLFRHMRANAGNNSKRDELHPYTQTLSLSDIESCILLEEATFPENERCTREKFDYRLRHCGELSMGIFTSLTDSDAATAATSAPVYSGAPKRKSVLLGHIIATKTTNMTVTDDDMAIPDDSADSEKYGHKEAGRTICIHSLAVLPQYQHRGLGKTLMQAYLQRIESHDVADRAALIAHDKLIPYYETFGFSNRGESKCKFAGGGWFDMVKDLDPGHDE